MSNLNYLTVYKTNLEKIRLGSKNDGGYVILDNLNYDILISCGIADDLNFENEFVKKYKTFCFGFDGTIINKPEHSDYIKLINKNIYYENSDSSTNLHELISIFNSIFLKMDIEAHEFRWLDTLSTFQMNKFSQIVIEFHYPSNNFYFFDGNLSLDIENKMKILQKMTETHVLVHLHPNNCCGTVNYNDIEVPNLFECTYVRKDLCKIISQTNDSIPNKIFDTKNVESMPEIELNFQPYTNYKKI